MIRRLRRALVSMLGVRRWEGGATDRLNKAHWSKATESPIDRDIQSLGPTIRARATYEASNNPFLEGCIDTHVTDIVGEDGPALQVLSEDERFNEAVERLWRRWWAAPDVAGVLSGAEILALSIRMVWLAGEFFLQTTKAGKPVGDDVSLRLQPIHPRRIRSDTTVDDQVVNGIRISGDGRPVSYTVHEDAVGTSLSAKPTEIQASQMIHGFRRSEPGQVRGVPLIATSMQSIADLRDYDHSVLDAARAAADNATLLYTEHPDAEYIEANETTPLKRRAITTVVPGWKVAQVKAEQPHTQYTAYRSERLREIGRPVSMPLMTVQLDAGNHSYSSARFDAQVYHRGVRRWQRWLTRVVLDRVLALIVQEAALIGASGAAPTMSAIARPPSEWTAKWTWPVPPHVDPLKESSADDIALRNGTTSRTMVCAKNGVDFFEVLAQRAIEQRQDDAATVARIVAVQKAIDEAVAETPSLAGLSWSHIISMAGATTAPGAYLQAAIGDESSSGAGVDPSKAEVDAGVRTMSRLNGAHR